MVTDRTNEAMRQASPPTAEEQALALARFRSRALKLIEEKTRQALAERDADKRKSLLDSVLRLSAAGMETPAADRLAPFVQSVREERALRRAEQDALRDPPPAPELVPRPRYTRPSP